MVSVNRSTDTNYWARRITKDGLASNGRDSPIPRGEFVIFGEVYVHGRGSTLRLKAGRETKLKTHFPASWCRAGGPGMSFTLVDALHTYFPRPRTSFNTSVTLLCLGYASS